MASQVASAQPATGCEEMAGIANEYAQDTIDEDPKDIEVAVLAYQFWESRGYPHGSDQEDWFKAERELQANGRRLPGVAVS